MIVGNLGDTRVGFKLFQSFILLKPPYSTLIPWFLRISVVRFSLVRFFKKCYFYYILKLRNAFLVTNDLNDADLVHADFCQT